MNFLGLSFLFALPLIAIPVIIHLYRGRQRDVVFWGAMQFLEQATTKGRSIQRLEELLLMLLRVAAVLALILALARPMMRSSWFGPATDREVVLLLDNSLSMARTVDGSSSGDQMVEKALEFIEELSPGDTVQVMLAAGGGQWLTAEGLSADGAGKRQLTELLQEVEPTLGTANLLDCLQVAVNIEPQNDPASRRIAVFTDDQSLSWQLDSEGTWKQLGSARENSKVPTTIETITCGVADTELKNLAVMKLEASRQMVQPDEPIELSARIANLGEATSAAATVEWLVDDKVFDTSELRSLAAGEATQVSVQLKQADSGNFAVTCRVEAEDQIAPDGEAGVVIEVSDQLPVLVVHDLESSEFTKTADELFTAALGYDGEKANAWHAVYEPHLAPVSQLEELTLARYRAIVFLSLSELSEEAHDSVQAFVRSGGGLWIALGDMVDSKSFNRFWYDDGGGISPIALEALVSVQDTNTPPGSIHPPQRDHPATEQLANTTQLDIDQARLTDYWQLVHRGNADRNAWVILEAGDGSPLVVENLVGEGRVLIQAFPLGLEWSNLPRLKSYVVMIQDWLDYLTAPAMARYNLEPGNAISTPVPAGAEVDTAKLVNPAGNEIALANAGSDENGLVRYSQTQLPGLYRLSFDTSGESLSLPFYVARDAEESHWQPLSAAARAQLTELAGMQFDGEVIEATPIANTEASPRATPIWGALLLGLLGLLIGEQLLANWIARQRDGVAVTT
ncbi:MAG: BatA domain-containing protein [Bythopirellula sp.]